MTTLSAIDIIYRLETLPPQIDYIRPSELQKKYEAEAFLDKLTPKIRDKAYKVLSNRINRYYEPIEDMGGHSIASLDAMF